MRYYQWTESKKHIQIGKIICLARTYKKHADEMQAIVPTTPVMFLKPSTSVIFSGESIRYPPQCHCLHHEIEMGVVIGSRGKDISVSDANDYIKGYCVGIDVTARDIQTEAKRLGLPWTMSKGFDTFAPISPVIDSHIIADSHNLLLELKVNGDVRQKETTANMVWTIEELISYISSIMTLEKGDLLLTGTPRGVSEINAGDVINATLDSHCFLQVTVK